MRLHDDAVRDIRLLIKEWTDNRTNRPTNAKRLVSWPRAGKNNIILKAETGLELGGPGVESISFLVWTNDQSLVSDNKITLVGADLPDIAGPGLPFGKVMIIGGHDFSPQNTHERFREMDLQRFDLDLEGYMVRAVSQEMKEWSRVSNEALGNGFSLSTLGSALIDKYKELDYVSSAEVLFVTSSPEDINALRPTGEKVRNVINAMRKMIEELSYDCAECDFQEICKETDGLKMLKKSLIKPNENGN